MIKFESVRKPELIAEVTIEYEGQSLWIGTVEVYSRGYADIRTSFFGRANKTSWGITELGETVDIPWDVMEKAMDEARLRITQLEEYPF